MSSGFMAKSTPKVWTLYDRLPENFQQWDFNLEIRGTSKLKKGMFKVQSDVSLSVRLDSLTHKVDALALSQTMKAESQIQ